MPGVTSAVAAPAAAGIPVTHRGLSASFTVVTGHRRIGEDALDWNALGHLVAAGGTLVILMGVAQRRDIAEALLASGVSPSTPVACIGDATLATQQVVRGRLDQLADLPITPPSVLVIGEVAALDFSGSPAGPDWFAKPR